MGRPKGSWTQSANPRWHGGRYTIATGYVYVSKPEHPNADKRGYVREHVLVMSDKIGRAISPDEVVHHINGIRNDNSPENLQLMKRSIHNSLHHKGLYKPESLKNLRKMTSEKAKTNWAARPDDRAKPKVCDHCGQDFYRKGNKRGKPDHAHIYCSRGCYFKARFQSHL